MCSSSRCLSSDSELPWIAVRHSSAITLPVMIVLVTYASQHSCGPSQQYSVSTVTGQASAGAVQGG